MPRDALVNDLLDGPRLLNLGDWLRPRLPLDEEEFLATDSDQRDVATVLTFRDHAGVANRTPRKVGNDPLDLSLVLVNHTDDLRRHRFRLRLREYEGLDDLDRKMDTTRVVVSHCIDESGFSVFGESALREPGHKAFLLQHLLGRTDLRHVMRQRLLETAHHIAMFSRLAVVKSGDARRKSAKHRGISRVRDLLAALGHFAGRRIRLCWEAVSRKLDSRG